jgi:uncharacterized protein (DUF983 family)
MPRGYQTVPITLGLIGPTMFTVSAMALDYRFDRSEKHMSTVMILSFAMSLIAALITLYRALTWRPWIKVVLAIPFVAISVAATLFGGLIFASDGL